MDKKNSPIRMTLATVCCSWTTRARTVILYGIVFAHGQTETGRHLVVAVFFCLAYPIMMCSASLDINSSIVTKKNKTKGRKQLGTTISKLLIDTTTTGGHS